MRWTARKLAIIFLGLALILLIVGRATLVLVGAYDPSPGESEKEIALAFVAVLSSIIAALAALASDDDGAGK